VSLHITDHAIDRYVSRVKPALDWRVGKAELEALVGAANRVLPGRPDWYSPGPAAPPGEGYVELADGIAGLVERGSVTTVVIRGEVTSSARAARNNRKRGRRLGRKKRSWSERRQLNPKREAPAWD
jgi:hypothetical protein